jgi:hypothetical protein
MRTQFKNVPVEQVYNYYIDIANRLKKVDEHNFNLFRADAKHLALNYFYLKNRSIQPEPISHNEASWIGNASYTALTYWEPYEGQVHSYDINSFYPYVMSKNFHYFPIKCGEFKIISEITYNTRKDGQGIPEFGIYRCIITKLDDKPYKFFKFNNQNCYTSSDIEVAKAYGLDITLIQDGNANFLYYSNDKLENGNMFKNYMHELYELKKDVKPAKILLNILWGALCETNHYKATATDSKPVKIKMES